MQFPLLEYVQATADATGTANAVIGPKKYGDRWSVNTLASASTSALESTLKVYRGAAVPTAQVASTYSGNNDNAGGAAIEIGSADKLVFQWTGATPGAVCTCRIEGILTSQRY